MIDGERWVFDKNKKRKCCRSEALSESEKAWRFIKLTVRVALTQRRPTGRFSHTVGTD